MAENDENQNTQAPNLEDTKKNSEMEKQPTIEDTEKQIQAEKIKQLELIKQKNQAMEEELKGKSFRFTPPSKDDVIKEQCNEILKSTGLKI
jgi:hypothetical protein